MCVYVCNIEIISYLKKGAKNTDDNYFCFLEESMKKNNVKNNNNLNVKYPDNQVAYFKMSGHLMQPH